MCSTSGQSKILEVEPGDECTHSQVPTRVVPNIDNPISICACPGLTHKQWRLNITRIIIKRHQLLQGEASVVRAHANRLIAKKIREIKPLLDPWVVYNDVIS